MLTLLQINVASNYGSTGKIVEQLGLLAKISGWNSYVAHGARYINPTKLSTIQVESKLGERIHGGWYSLLQDKHGLGSICATQNLIRKIKVINPDIIHLHNIHGYFINYKILFEFLSNTSIPVIWTLHDCWPMTGHCSHFDLIKCERWKTQCYSCPLKNEYPKSLFLDRSRENYILKKELFTSLGSRLTLVPVSNWLEDIVRQSFFKDAQICTIHNGIDLAIFMPHSTEDVVKKYQLQGKAVLLGVAAPWTQRKGFNDFFNLRKLLPSRYAIIMVGLSSKQIAELPEGIIGIERTQNVNELAQLYSVADAFINTTYEDNYPTVNLEAIACGTPVITYRTGGSPESVTPQTGRVVEQGNIEQLVQAIHELEKTDREQIRQKCRDYAVEHFDKQKCFQKYIELYNNILNIK